jgi:hypothetical protein
LAGFPASAERERAFQGDVVAKFEGDGPQAQERAPGAPLLDVYTPIRQTGTNRIIALAETSEVAVELMREIRSAQYASCIVIASAAPFSLTDGLQTRMGELALHTAAHEQFRRRVFKANGRVQRKCAPPDRGSRRRAVGAFSGKPASEHLRQLWTW